LAVAAEAQFADGTGHQRYRHPPDGKSEPNVHTGSREPAAARLRPAAPRAGLSRCHRLVGALTGLVVLPLLTLGLARFRDVVTLPSQTLLNLLAVVVALVAFVLVAGAAGAVVGLAARRREAETTETETAESREELRRLADEQAALRRVATLIAHGLPPAEVFPAVAHEVGSVLGADVTNIVRLDPDGAATILARVGAPAAEFPVGSRWRPEPPLAVAVVLRTGRPARLDDTSQAAKPAGRTRSRWRPTRAGICDCIEPSRGVGCP